MYGFLLAKELNFSFARTKRKFRFNQEQQYLNLCFDPYISKAVQVVSLISAFLTKKLYA
jgi:hypothetical protein